MQNHDICKAFLEKLLRIKVLSLKFIVPEYNIELSPVNKSVRVDVFVRDEKGDNYNIEMQSTPQKAKIIAKRSRYYQANIDLNTLAKGEDYDVLCRSSGNGCHQRCDAGGRP